MIANVILLSNDIQLNPGPGPTQHREMRGLRLFHLKVDELRLFCETHKRHVLSINETWLDESFSDEEIWLPGFNLLRKDRLNCHGGGLAVYIAEHLSFNRLDEVNPELMCADLEAIWFELSQPKSKKLLLGSIYRSPNSDISAFNSSLEMTLNNLKVARLGFLGATPLKLARERRRISGCRLSPPKTNVCELEPENDFRDVESFVFSLANQITR